MKRLLDGMVVSLGTLCLFGMPVTAVVLSAWLGDSLMGMLHFSDSAMHQASYQIGTVALIFATSAGGLLVALLLMSVLWSVMRAVARQAEALEPLPMVAARTPTAPRVDTRGRMERGAARR